MTVDPLARSLRAELQRLWLGCWVEHLFREMLRGLCFGLALALGGALVLIVHAGLVKAELLLLLAAAGLVVGLFGSLVRPPSRLGAARVADARLIAVGATGARWRDSRTASAPRSSFWLDQPPLRSSWLSSATPRARCGPDLAAGAGPDSPPPSGRG